MRSSNQRIQRYLEARAALLRRALWMQETCYEDAERIEELQARLDELRCAQKEMERQA